MAGDDRVSAVHPFKGATIDIDEIGISLPPEGLCDPFTAISHGAVYRQGILSLNSGKTDYIKVVVAYPGGTLNMAYVKFSIGSGIEYMKMS